MSADESQEELAGQTGRFATTRWSVVLQVGDGNTPEAALALDRLCRAYWHPLYCYVRRRGFGTEDARDIIQGFFLQLLEHKSFEGIDPARGRFRSFLLGALNYYISDDREKAHAQKRGGGQFPVPFDFEDAESRYGVSLADTWSPDKAFERQWALTLLDQVLTRLEQEYCEAGRDRLFVALKPFLVEASRAITYAEVGAQLGVSEEVVKKSVQRLRRRYGRLFREEIAHTLGDPAHVEDELRYLRQVLSQ
jgi:RNA polymerase sigma factor (sigma-70 family)